MVAKSLLDQREGDIAQGKLPGIHFEKVKFDELAEDFLRDYRVNNRKSTRRAKVSVGHLKEYFEGYKVPQITTARVQAYIELRLDQYAANASINRELSSLKRMLNLGARQTPPRVQNVPYIEKLKENNVRKGFFEVADFEALREALPEYLRGFVTFAYKTGWRLSEIENLKWNQIDFDEMTATLDPGETKNDEGRTVYLDDELQQILLELFYARKKSQRLLQWVFLNDKGDDRIKQFTKSWKNACSEAGIGKRLFHDFRRTAVRNMVRSGIPERVAMMISGHKSRSVFERYNIVSDEDLKMAAQRQSDYLESQKTTDKTVTVVDFQKKRG